MIQLFQDPSHSQGIDLGRRQFQRQRQSVQALADLCKDRPVAATRFESLLPGANPLDQQLHRRACLDLVLGFQG
ncbi:hypothetical protein D3C84_1151140 [compost metagenome]